MKAKNLIILIVVAALLCGWAYLSSKRKNRLTEAATVIGKPLLSRLQDAEQLNSIASIAFVTAQGTIDVAKVDGVWVSPAKHNYPVKFDSVRDFLRKLADLKIGQSLPSDPKQMESLDLVSPEGAAEDAQNTGTLVKLTTESGSTVASLLLGKERSRQAPEDSPYGQGFGAYPDGRFVAAEGKACLVTESFSGIPDDAKAWLDTRVANVSASDLASLSVADPEGATVTLVRAEGKTDMVLPDLAEGEEMDTVKVSGLAGTLSWLDFEDVVDPDKAEAELGFDKATVLTAVTKDDKIYTLMLGAGPEGSESRYARLKAEYVPPEPELAEETAEAEPDVEEGEAQEDTTEVGEEADAAAQRAKEEEQKKLAGEVKEFNDKVGGWTYMLPSHKIKNIDTDRQALLKERKVEEEKAVEPAAVAPEPVPVSEPAEVAPEPAPAPELPAEAPAGETEPAPQPEPDPQPEVTPEPQPEAAPEPQAAPEPEPLPEDK